MRAPRSRPQHSYRCCRRAARTPPPPPPSSGEACGPRAGDPNAIYHHISGGPPPYLALSQETHRQLIKSNEHLLAQLQETKDEHALEAAQYRRNFDELKQTVALRQAMPPPADTAPPEPGAGERGRKGKRQAAS